MIVTIAMLMTMNLPMSLGTVADDGIQTETLQMSPKEEKRAAALAHRITESRLCNETNISEYYFIEAEWRVYALAI